MMRKRFSPGAALLGTLLTSIGLGLLPACDVVDNPIPPKTTLSAGKQDSLSLDSAETAYLAQPGHATPVQRVLLEDYTGHQCGNCPRAARKAMELDSIYPDRIITIATHVGFYADTTPAPYTYDFNTPAGRDLNRVFGVELRGLPQGMINRALPTNATSPLVSDGAWTSLVAAELTRTPEQQLIVSGQRNEAGNAIRLKVRSTYLVAQPGHTYKLVLNILEDSLTEWQEDYSLRPGPTKVEKYLHRHILRADLTGTFGTVNAVNPTLGQTVETYLNYPLPATSWASRPLTLVAYLLDATDPEAKSWPVVQAAETKL